MASSPPRATPVGATARLLARLDAAANRLYGSRYNPLYRSGTATVALLALLIATGLYLLLFYRVGAPYASVRRIADQAWLGRWIRTVHRFAADAAVITATVHAIRMLAQRRSWGRRTLPWVSGVGLLALILVCGWTGYVMVWDTFGQLLAVEGARLLDLLPLFSEPLGRAFVGESAIPGAFFFLNLFLHIALPIGMGIGLLLHVSRMARAVLFPPRRAMAWGAALLVAAALAWPAPLAPEADPFRLPATVPLDLFYAFWVPLARGVPAPWVAGTMAAATLLLLLVPRLTRPAPHEQPPPSEVNERLCTGCRQCALDCPWEAIAMVPREDEPGLVPGGAPRSELVARVDPARCVSCGICAGSCAPMGIGPAGRTGRDQLAEARELVRQRAPGAEDVVVVACTRGAGGAGWAERFDGAPVFAVDCAGNLHSSVVELFVRAGAGGVLVLACPPEDCWNREGAVWLEQRLFHDREAELQARVDRRRVMLAHASLGGTAHARAALAELRARVRALRIAGGEDDPDLRRQCETAAAPGAAAGGEP
ncbi:MAG TPA: hydrogenase iron-sulfur subunit [Gemmatimonadaceae bacterium]|nr:hydrogenase iron-sulfur subunit [Gemmatimonadaceae bacterium]